MVDDEARRRAKRRERNRVAAAKCRQRRQDQIEELQHRVNALTKTGKELRGKLQSMDAERTRLVTLIQQHRVSLVVRNGCGVFDERFFVLGAHQGGRQIIFYSLVKTEGRGD